MVRMLESELQSKIIKWCERHDIICWKIMKGNKDGIPDLFFAYQGKQFWMEIKRDANEKLRPSQKKRRQELFDHNIACYVYYDLKEALNTISWHCFGKSYETVNKK